MSFLNKSLEWVNPSDNLYKYNFEQLLNYHADRSIASLKTSV